MSKNVYTPPDRSTYDPGWNDPPPMPTGPPTTNSVSTKPRLNLNKRVAFPVQSGTAQTTQNVKTTSEGLPLPFSTAKYDPRIFNPVSNSVQTQLPPPPSMPLLPPSAFPMPPPVSTLPSAASELPETTSAMPGPASDLIQTASTVPETDSALFPPVSSVPSVVSTLTTSSSPLPPPPSVSAAPPSIFAPPLSLTSQIPLANVDTSLEPTEAHAFNSEEAREYCRKVFDRLLVTPKTPTDSQKVAEIRKRLDILHHMWNEKKFDETMQKIIHQLATALDTDNPIAAMDKHRILGTTFVSLSMQWATALRHLILINSTNSSEADEGQSISGGFADNLDAVPFLDVSSNAGVLNAPVLPIDTIQVVNQAGQTTTNQASIEPERENCDLKLSTTKSSRFGRILHL